MKVKGKNIVPTLKQIEELVSFLPRLYAEGFSPVKKWHGGEKDDDGAITMPYPEYDPIVDEFFQAASAECWMDYEYLSKSKAHLLDDEGAVETADLDQIKTMLTFCVRGERFCTGHWGAVIESGYCTSSKDSGLQGIRCKRDFQLIRFMFMQPSAYSIADVSQPAFSV